MPSQQLSEEKDETRILIVDDDEAVSGLFRTYLSERYECYTASNFAGGLRINGVAIAPIWGSADIPEEFEHTNIQAVLVSTVSKPTVGRPRLAANGAIQFTVIDGRGGQTNVIAASDDLVTWTAISTNVFPATTCPICPFIEFQDTASTNLTRRFYRSFTLP